MNKHIGLFKQFGGNKLGLGDYHRGDYLQYGNGSYPLMQNGSGLGGILASAFKALLPVAGKSFSYIKFFLSSDTGRSLTKKAKNAAFDVGANLLEGKDIKTSLDDSLSKVKKDIAKSLRQKAKKRPKLSKKSSFPTKRTKYNLFD
jgi:hypothetical protein